MKYSKIIEQNMEKVLEVATQAVKDALENRHLRFIVEIDKNGNPWAWYDVAGGNAFTTSSWEGKSYVICSFCYQYMDIEITKENLIEHMTEEEKKKVEEEIEGTYQTFSSYVFSNRRKYMDIINQCEDEYLDWYKYEYAAEEAESKIYDDLIRLQETEEER